MSTFKDLTLILEPEVFGLTNVELGAALKAEGIDSRRYYAPPIHRQRAYAHLRAAASCRSPTRWPTGCSRRRFTAT